MKKTNSILSFIDDDEVIQVTRDLVATPSITHSEGRGMVTFMESWFGDLGIPVRLYPASNDRANFFADYGAESGPGRFLFNGHQDTKPVDGMTIDPFGREICDGRMYGRGACDMKGAIAGILRAFKSL
ncbi:MAG: M20/M25/M40 family metallo-hydrolase, partial [Candidatus Latescibacteria bacterium]|nr:M20/M25/M40 family metallo-hydrolase [Candidatus Latescibacterota bacterium]